MATQADQSQNQRIWFPDVNDIDTAAVEVFYDADLDELTILFCDKGRRHSLLEIGENRYALVDTETEEVVGFEIHRFMKKTVPQHPEFLHALSVAAILSNEPEARAPRIDPKRDRSKLRSLLKRIVEPRSAEIRLVLRSFESMQHHQDAQ